MTRNTEIHFKDIPKIHQPRAKMDESCSVTTTMNCADVIPVKVWEILPGDTVEMDMSSIVRLTTPIVPTMDNLITDYYFFFVPRRLTWDHWEQFWGQNDDEWTQTNTYEVPQVTSPTGGWLKGSIADYMSMPTKIANMPVDACYFRGYVKIWNDWFRDENLKKASHLYTDDTGRTGTNGTNYVQDPELGGMPLKAAKTADMFTKCQPTPQKGPSVSVPIGTNAPVGTGKTDWDTTTYESRYANPLNFRTVSGGHFIDQNLDNQMLGIRQPNPGTGSGDIKSYTITSYTGPNWSLAPTNLYADLEKATAATINELRTAFAIQKYYESVALYGRA